MARIPDNDDHRTQLQRPVTGPYDCGPRTGQHLYIKTTGGRGRVPGIEQMRRQMGRNGAQPTNVYDMDRFFIAQGLHYARIVGGIHADLVGALRAGKGLQICVSYGVVTNLQPSKSGAPDFRGGHSIYIDTLRRSRRHGARIVRSGDSLFDGRRPGIPSDAFHWVRLETYLRATQAFAGRSGLWWGGIVPPWRGDAAGPGEDEGWHEPIEPDIDDVAPIDPDMDPESGDTFPLGSTGEDLDDRDLGHDDDDEDDDLEEVPEDEDDSE